MSSLVVKLGGHALHALNTRSPVLVDLAQDIAQLRAQGTDVVVVHGGGPQIAALLASVGLESRFHEGLRVTDRRTMSYTAMALGEVNLLITAALNQAGLASAGVSGADATMTCAASLGEPWERAGGVPKVRDDIVTTLWAAGLTPIVSPVAVDEFGDLLNCNADTVAGALAAALGAEVLVLLSDVDQLRSEPDDASTALSLVTAAQVREMLASQSARDGMRPKVNAALDALDGGAHRVLLANGTRRHALRDALARSIPTTEVVR
jgi:acetylglutamate kinase